MIEDKIIKILSEIFKVFKRAEEIQEVIKEYFLDGIEIFAINLFSLFVLIRLFLQWYVNYFGINGSVVITNLENEYPEKLAMIFASFAIITALHYTWRKKKSRQAVLKPF